MEEDLILVKAQLVSSGAVRLPKDYRPPYRYSRSTAGPGAGDRELVFSFGSMHVKKRVSVSEGDFEFDPRTNTILKKGKLLVKGVSILPADLHCPEQAFFNLDRRCRYNCLFCPSPLMKDDAMLTLDAETIIRNVRGSKNPIHSTSLTSGIHDSISETADRIAECISEIRREFPEMPIGVEPYLNDPSQIDKLHEAGATEIKINVETATEKLFRKFCPQLDYDNVFDMLAHCVEVFGKGKVSSNIIIGLGETDDDVVSMMEKLCSMGVTPTVRGLRIGSIVKDKLAENGITEQPPYWRLVNIAKVQKNMMKKYDLDPRTFDTMCLKCTCCDLVPFIDL